jgi:hypothetical protein
MKKLVYIICMGLLLPALACNSICSEVNTIARCCKAVAAGKHAHLPVEGKNNSVEFTNGAWLLPFNSWDSKMMFW